MRRAGIEAAGMMLAWLAFVVAGSLLMGLMRPYVLCPAGEVRSHEGECVKAKVRR